jgi:hypothetical protein
VSAPLRRPALAAAALGAALAVALAGGALATEHPGCTGATAEEVGCVAVPNREPDGGVPATTPQVATAGDRDCTADAPRPAPDGSRLDACAERSGTRPVPVVPDGGVPTGGAPRP